MEILKVGEVYESNNCGLIKCVEYVNAKKVKVSFIETGYEVYTSSSNIRGGKVRDTSLTMKVGDVFKSRRCGDVVVTEYINSTKVKIRFVETGFERYAHSYNIRIGKVNDTTLLIKVGDVFTSKNCGDFKVLSYSSAKRIEVEFLATGYKTFTQTDHINEGGVKDVLAPTVLGVGFIGDGEYKSSVGGVTTAEYVAWHGMLSRCYSTAALENSPTYIDCFVCCEWRDYQVFAQWYNETYPVGAIQGEFHLDKDILVDGNKIYSPTTCKWVSPRENTVKSGALYYKFINPSGDVVEIYNLKEFCRGEGLTSPTMYCVHNGKAPSHKGWVKYEEEG